MSVPMPTSDTKQIAIREARRRLQEKIKNDWSFTYEPSCPALSALAAESSAQVSHPIDEPDTDGGRLSDGTTSPSSNKLPHFAEWRERTYASSDPSSDEDADDPYAKRKPDMLLRRKRDILFGSSASDLHPSSSIASPDTPRGSSSEVRNSQTPPTQEDIDRRRRAARSARRRHKLETEMAWNEGLRFWQARRDNWCCAKTVPRGQDVADDLLADTPAQHDDSGHGSAETQSSEEGSSGGMSLELKRNIEAGVTLVPVAPPLIPPGDPTHISITPSLYPSIYSKIVVQSLTPSVPINLRYMLDALIDGWKRDGEWPPKGETNVTASIAQTMSSARASAAASGESHGARLGGLAAHFGVRKGMAKMRRSLRLSLSGGSGTGTGTGTGDERGGHG